MTAAWPGNPGTHTALFYEREPFWQRGFEAFLVDGARAGATMVVIGRRRMFEDAISMLESSPLDSVRGSSDRIVFTDAETTMLTVMHGDTLLAERVERELGALLERAARVREHVPVWIIGEMLDLMCREGHHGAALDLEKLWNVLTADRPIVTGCAYALDRFSQDCHTSVLTAICDQHTHVIAPARSAVSTVYVIDDDPSVRRSLARLLASVDLPVRTFDSAEAFLEETDPAASGCLIVDIQLLGMSGTDLMQRLAAVRSHLPVVAMSGAYDVSVEQEALRLGAVAFLRKPFVAETLLEAIARALSRGRLLRLTAGSRPDSAV
jgi:CheY-like chemotaxis protein